MLNERILFPIDLRLFDGGETGGAGAEGDPGQAAAPREDGPGPREEGMPQAQPRGDAAASRTGAGEPGEAPVQPPEPDGDVRKMESAYRAHVFAAAQSARWAAEGEALRAREPDFDLDAMRGDPVFALLLTHGVPMERAWRASTVDERVSRAAAAAEKAVTDHIRLRGARPPEAGSGGGAAYALRPDVSRLSDSEVLGVLARLDRHERVSFG